MFAMKWSGLIRVRVRDFAEMRRHGIVVVALNGIVSC
jgi:hypothetical protein